MTRGLVWRAVAIAAGTAIWTTTALLDASPAVAGPVRPVGPISVVSPSPIHPVASRIRVLEASSSAVPTPWRPAVRDVEDSTRRTGAREVHASAKAVARTTCDGCQGDAVTLQVVHLFGSRQVTANNLASARSSCTGCGASALSVQVVIAFRPQVVRVDNAARAINTSCTRCNTDAAAYQFVLVSDSMPQLSRDARALVAQIEHEMADLLDRPGSTSALRAALDLRADRIESVLERDLRVPVAKRHLALDRS